MDTYHLLKHRRRTRPDQLSEAQRDPTYGLPWHIRAHRRLIAPLQKVRRSVLKRLDPGHADAPK